LFITQTYVYAEDEVEDMKGDEQDKESGRKGAAYVRVGGYAVAAVVEGEV
jgi:hypothetical protein